MIINFLCDNEMSMPVGVVFYNVYGFPDEVIGREVCFALFLGFR